MLSTWFRVIRIRFLLASLIAVSSGLAMSWWHTSQLDLIHAILTMGGVLALHASVDLLNDYWDFKRGIDLNTTKTKMSGGTGVLPEGLLKPSQVYKAGIIFLVLGAVIGAYFVLIQGWVIGAILAFAIFSIYFYSTKIVDSGLAEVFVTVKGAMIVLGTYFIQTSEINMTPLLGGFLIGVLSSFVLFITSFPDYEADKSKGRKTLMIALGQKKAASFFWIFPIVFYSGLLTGVILEIFPVFCLLTLGSFPFLVMACKNLKNNYDNVEKLIPIMEMTLYFSRITGAVFVLGFIIGY